MRFTAELTDILATENYYLYIKPQRAQRKQRKSGQKNIRAQATSKTTKSQRHEEKIAIEMFEKQVNGHNYFIIYRSVELK